MEDPTPPPRAFTQGVGLVFQFVGVSLFLSSSLVCCGSGLLSKDWATQSRLTHTGWGNYSAQQAFTISVFAAVVLGMGMATIGLGMQADYRAAPTYAIILTTIGALFWLIQTIFAAQAMGSVAFAIISGALAAVFLSLLGLALIARSEVRKNPPPAGHDVVPPGYKIPYSHYHDDPPEVRLAAELEQRRQRLSVQQKELEMLEEKLKKTLEERREEKS